jgi:hypothetical protein
MSSTAVANRGSRMTNLNKGSSGNFGALHHPRERGQRSTVIHRPGGFTAEHAEGAEFAARPPSREEGQSRPRRTPGTRRAPRTPSVGIVSQAAGSLYTLSARVNARSIPRVSQSFRARRGSGSALGAVLRGLGVLRVLGGLLLPLGATAGRRALCGPPRALRSIAFRPGEHSRARPGRDA